MKEIVVVEFYVLAFRLRSEFLRKKGDYICMKSADLSKPASCLLIFLFPWCYFDYLLSTCI